VLLSVSSFYRMVLLITVSCARSIARRRCSISGRLDWKISVKLRTEL